MPAFGVGAPNQTDITTDGGQFARAVSRYYESPLHADPWIESALDVRTTARTLLGYLVQIGECPEQVVRTHVCQPETPHARRIDDPSALGQRERHGRRGGVPSLARHLVDVPGHALGLTILLLFALWAALTLPASRRHLFL